MKRFLRKFLIYTVILIGISIGILIIIAGFFENQISNKLLTEINKQLKSELKVEEFNLSLLSGFPDASANLRNVILEDNMEGTILEAGNLSFRFSLFSLFSSKIKVHSIVIEDGALFINVDKRGNANYNILKSSGETSTSDESSDFALSIEEASLKDVELIYVNEQTHQEIMTQVKDASISGEFSSDDFSLISLATLETNFIELDGRRFFVGKDIVYNAKMDVDFKTGKYVLENVDLAIESNVFKVDGIINSKNKDTEFDLILTSKDSNIEAVFDLLPEEYLAYFSDFKSKGKFFFNTTVKGHLNATENPSIDMQFGLKDGQISSDRLDNALRDVTFTAHFSNGEERSNQKSVFEVTDFKGYFNRELIESKIKITNLDDPYIDFKLNGVLPLGSVYGLFNHASITDGDGEIEFNDLILKGRYKDMQYTSRIGRVETGGLIEFDDAELKINKEDMVIDKGKMLLQDNSLTMDNVKIEGAGSEIYINGNFLNIIPVLFADSLNSKKAELKFKATLEASEMDFDRLAALADVPLAQKTNDKTVMDSLEVVKNQKRERFTNFLDGIFQAKIDEFNYNKIKGENFSGSFEFDNNELVIKGNAHGMQGDFKVNGKMFFEDKPHLKARFVAKDIDATTFFEQSENFGQDVLKSKHVKGSLDGKFAVYAYWDEEGNFLTDEMRILGDIGVHNGELVGFKMLYDFSKFIKIEDLRRIKFTNMRNWLEVKKGVIHMPAMFIQSNALNMTISGEHSLENDIDYNIKVNAGQLLANKFKRHDSKLKPHPSKRKGWFNLYYRIYGDLADYDMKRDKKTVKRKFKSSERRKKEIQAALVKEFGNIASLSEPKGWKDEEEPVSATDNKNSLEEEEVFLDFEVEGNKVTGTKDNNETTNSSNSDDEEYIDW